MSPAVWEAYIRDEQAYYLRTGCPRTFADLRESFQRYYRALRPLPDWSAK